MKIGKMTAALALMMVIPLAACEVEQTEQGELPDVEVEEEGQMPEYDADAPDVDVNIDTTDADTLGAGTPDVESPAEEEPGGEGGGTY